MFLYPFLNWHVALFTMLWNRHSVEFCSEDIKCFVKFAITIWESHPSRSVASNLDPMSTHALWCPHSHNSPCIYLFYVFHLFKEGDRKEGETAYKDAQVMVLVAHDNAQAKQSITIFLLPLFLFSQLILDAFSIITVIFFLQAWFIYFFGAPPHHLVQHKRLHVGGAMTLHSLPVNYYWVLQSK